MFIRTLVATAALILGLAAMAIAQPPQNPEAMRSHADELARQAAELRSQGHHEEARALAREAEELLKAAAAAERDEHRMMSQENREAMKNDLAQLQADRDRLVDQGMGRSAIEPIERRIAELEKELGIQPAPEPKPRDNRPEDRPEPHDVPPRDEPGPEFKPISHIASPQELEAIERRIHHLRIASDNLRAADMPDRANELEQEAIALERERDRIISPEPTMENERIRILEVQMDDLHNEIRELRAEVRRLAEELKRVAASRIGTE
jgi:hypothetical protein